jgi:aminoglycoside 3-N-acetyltransferase
MKRKIHTKTSLIDDLKKLGMQRGMTVIVHSSLKSIGTIVGGVVSIILALEETVGNTGNIVMPTQSEHLCDPTEYGKGYTDEEIKIIRDNMPLYYPDLTPTSYMGFVPETFRKQRNVMRSSHPHASFSAWGKNAKYITENHELDYALNENSPLGKVYQLGGYILLLGAPTDSNSSLHLAEYRQKNSFVKPKIWDVKMLVNGEEKWITYNDINNESDDFDKIFEDYYKYSNTIREGFVGDAKSYLISQREMVDYALQWMNVNRK